MSAARTSDARQRWRMLPMSNLELAVQRYVWGSDRNDLDLAVKRPGLSPGGLSPGDTARKSLLWCHSERGSDNYTKLSHAFPDRRHLPHAMVEASPIRLTTIRGARRHDGVLHHRISARRSCAEPAGPTVSWHSYRLAFG